MDLFTKLKSEFHDRYFSMLNAVKSKVNNIVVCTVHDSVPNIEPRALTALSMFNEVILREAFSCLAPVIDLRLVCNEKADYSDISPIEPSKQGGDKITDLIVRVAEQHDFESDDSRVYL